MCFGGSSGSLAAQGFGLGMSTAGAFFSAKGEQDALRYQAQMAEINARIADSNARAAVEQGLHEEINIKFQGERLKSKQRAAYAAGGIDIAGSNSALAVLTGTDVITEANRTRANAVRAAWGQRFEALNLRNQARSARATAKGISPGLAAATNFIEGAGKVASSWYSLDKQGAFDGKTPPSASESKPSIRVPFTTSIPAMRYSSEQEAQDFRGWGY